MPSEFAQVKKDLEALVVKYEKQTGKDRKEIFLGRKMALCLCAHYGFSYEEMKQLPFTENFGKELYDGCMEDRDYYAIFLEDDDYYANKGHLFDKIKKEIERQIKKTLSIK